MQVFVLFCFAFLLFLSSDVPLKYFDSGSSSLPLEEKKSCQVSEFSIHSKVILWYLSSVIQQIPS